MLRFDGDVACVFSASPLVHGVSLHGNLSENRGWERGAFTASPGTQAAAVRCTSIRSERMVAGDCGDYVFQSRTDMNDLGERLRLCCDLSIRLRDMRHFVRSLRATAIQPSVFVVS